MDDHLLNPTSVKIPGITSELSTVRLPDRMNISLASTRLVAGFGPVPVAAPLILTLPSLVKLSTLISRVPKRGRAGVERTVNRGWIERRLARRGHANEVQSPCRRQQKSLRIASAPRLSCRRQATMFELSWHLVGSWLRCRPESLPDWRLKSQTRSAELPSAPH